MATKTGAGRAAVYVRFSSANQREASIDDQIEVCRRYISQHGWPEVAVYEDRAISGASRFRHGFQQLLADAEVKRPVKNPNLHRLAARCAEGIGPRGSSAAMTGRMIGSIRSDRTTGHRSFKRS
jgi:hypothetical protein